MVGVVLAWAAVVAVGATAGWGAALASVGGTSALAFRFWVAEGEYWVERRRRAGPRP